MASAKKQTTENNEQLTFSALVKELGRSLDEARAIFDISPESVLNAEQEAQIREWGAPAVDQQAEADRAAIIQLMALELIDSAKREAMVRRIDSLVVTYIESQGHVAPKDKVQAAYVRKLAETRGKPQPHWDGQDIDLANQIEIIDGEVVLPEIYLPEVEMQTPAALSEESPPIAELPAA